MDYHKIQLVLVISVFMFSAPNAVYSAIVECNSGGGSDPMRKACVVNVDDPYADVTRVKEELSGFNCVKNTHYGYLYYGPGQAYVWVMLFCGGTFEVTATKRTWSKWGAWSACSVTCGAGGVQSRTRTCPSGRSSDCSDNDNHNEEVRNCVVEDCKTPVATWNIFGEWSACSASCGGGSQQRIRTCSTGNNIDCSSRPNAYLESRTCNTQACPGTTGTTNEEFCGKSPSQDRYRILGGANAQNCQYPWMVLVYNARKRTSCGGSILDATHILTAAHCVVSKDYFQGIIQESPSSLRIFTGSSTMPFGYHSIRSIPGLFMRGASHVEVHEDYDSKTIENDIAIITLTEPIQFDNCHVPLCLPSAQQSALGASGCKVMGWGVTSNSRYSRSSADLKYTDIDVVDAAYCSRFYGYIDSKIKLCAGGEGQGSCSGDSGGPLVCPGSDGRYYQYGIVSSGADGLCAVRPGMYTNVTSYLSWITTHSK